MVYNLDGEWALACDPTNRGRENGWATRIQPEARSVRVPWIIQGVFPGYHGVAWYWKEFAAPPVTHDQGRILMRFWAVDYLADVWLNGQHLGNHEGGETPFTLDATAAIVPNGKNLVAVRVLNPTNEPIDGITLAETPHRNKTVPVFAGASFNHGGIVDSVELLSVPAVRIAELRVWPDPNTGRIAARVRTENSLKETVPCHLRVSVSSSPSGETLDITLAYEHFAPGEKWWETQVSVHQPNLWRLNDPCLYRVTAQVTPSDGQSASEYSVRCGFRDFRFEKGFFRLNGERLFLRGSHTGNHSPIGQQIAPDPDMFRRDLLNVKVMGFNMIRFIAGVGTRYQLDLCDEIGLLVYEESYAGWLLGDSPRMKYLFERSVSEMVQRDLNHPSVVIWGLLNETNDGPVFRHAVESLRIVREIDRDRVILLNSGRWDGQQSIGSLANPGSLEWEHCLGGEAPGAATTGSTWGGYFEQAGDAHAYPRVPHTTETIDFLRKLGQGTKTVFLTEYGIGSAVDLWRVSRHFEGWGATDAEDAIFYRELLDRFMVDWDRWDLGAMFPRPSDYFAACVRKMAGQRLLGLNAIRSNPQIIGHNMTGTVDQGLTGEGLFTTFRELKPGTTDAIADGLARLRWCLFAEPVHAYADQPVLLEAVIADEDCLRPGTHIARFTVVDPDGVRVFEVRKPLSVAEKEAERPLARPVFAESLAFSGKPGPYRFLAEFEMGAAATGGEVLFYVTEAAKAPLAGISIIVWGDDPGLVSWLANQGADVLPAADRVPDSSVPILLAKPLSSARGPDAAGVLEQLMQGGATVIGLTPEVFADGKDLTAFLPLKEKGAFHALTGWLYLKDEWAKRHPVFDGVPAGGLPPTGGLLDYDYFREVIPDLLYTPGDGPCEAIAGAIRSSQGYSSGLMVSIHPVGAGRLVINTLRLRGNLGRHPAVDRLLINILRYAAGEGRKK